MHLVRPHGLVHLLDLLFSADNNSDSRTFCCDTIAIMTILPLLIPSFVSGTNKSLSGWKRECQAAVAAG